MVGLCLTSFGCSTLSQRFSRRSEKCGSLCEQSRTAREQGWPDQADLLLNEAIRQKPADVETRRQLAESLWEAGRRDAALAEYAELVQLQPDDAGLQTRLAEIYWIQGNLAAAGRMAETVLQLDPNSTYALLVKARVEAAQGQYEHAVATYIRLIQLSPEGLEVRQQLAEVHIRRGHPDQACPLLRDAMQLAQITPEQRADAEWRLGLAYAAAERWTDAARHLGHSIEQREASDRDWQCLAAAKVLSGQDAEGAKAMARLASLQSDPNASTVWSELQERLIERAYTGESLASGASRGGVVRADFNRSAMAGDQNLNRSPR